MTLNKTQIAKIYGLSRNSITDWTIVGCPHMPGRPGQPARFNLDRVIEWRRERLLQDYVDPSLVSEEARKARRRARSLVRRRKKK
jgi:phage terminase Nu1 subunit (DNA packaging protein)